MVGGLLNLIAVGPEDIILIGNPTKSFFTRVYAKYTNFGLQRFRIDFEGQRELQVSEPTSFKFKIPRYADLLMDTYFVINLPNIWSPIFSLNHQMKCADCRTGNFTQTTVSNPLTDISCGRKLPIYNYITYDIPYEFKWIDSIGAQMIRNVRLMADDQVLQEFTGQYLYSMVQRDFSDEKRKLFDEMIGNVSELNDPANYSNRNGNYPNASYMGRSLVNNFSYGLEPSIRGRQLYVPLNIWSTLSSKMAIPLVSMQYSELSIEIDIRPIDELFVVRDIEFGIKTHTDWNLNDCSGQLQDFSAEIPYIHPDCTNELYSLYLFLKEPPPSPSLLPGIDLQHDGTINAKESVLYDHYYPWLTRWAADVHLVGTYVFLGDEEVKQFSTKCQSYLIREVHEQTIYDLVGKQYTPIRSMGLVTSWMWFFQRSDVNKRNEWSNYSNWAYLKGPLQAKNNAVFIYLEYLQQVFLKAGDLTTLYQKYPKEFIVLYLLFIIAPLADDNTPLISPFIPPSMFGEESINSGGTFSLAYLFHKLLHEVEGKWHQAVLKWYQATTGQGTPDKEPIPGLLSAPIRSIWPLSCWCFIPANHTERRGSHYLDCSWNRPNIDAKSRWGPGIPECCGSQEMHHDNILQLLNPIPVKGSADNIYKYFGKEPCMKPGFKAQTGNAGPDLGHVGNPQYRWDMMTCCSGNVVPSCSSTSSQFCGSNPVIPLYTECEGAPPSTADNWPCWNNHMDWSGNACAMPFCPIVCATNNEDLGKGYKYGTCQCYCDPPTAPCSPTSLQFCDIPNTTSPNGTPPQWTSFTSPCVEPPLCPDACDVNRPDNYTAPAYWCESFDANGSYDEMKAKFGYLVNYIQYNVGCNNPVCNILGTLSDVFVTGDQSIENVEEIMLDWGFNLDETLRETVWPAGVANYLDKYTRTAGNAKSGLYCYNFCLHTDPFIFQPSGAINMSIFSNIAWSYKLIDPSNVRYDPLNSYLGVPVSITCDADGVPIDNKSQPTSSATNYWKNYEYTFNMHIMEERYNMVVIENGVARLALAR